MGGDWERVCPFCFRRVVHLAGCPGCRQPWLCILRRGGGVCGVLRVQSMQWYALKANTGDTLALKAIEQHSTELVNVQHLRDSKRCPHTWSRLVPMDVVERFAVFQGVPMALLVMERLEPMEAWAPIASVRELEVAVVRTCEVCTPARYGGR